MKTTMNGNRIKFLSFPIIIISALFITSCNKEIKVVQANNDGMIMNSKLTDREQQLMRGIGADRFFIFDVNLKNKEINEVECWVDYYENGELNNKVIETGTSVGNSKDTTGIIMLSIQSNLVNEAEEKWIISYRFYHFYF